MSCSFELLQGGKDDEAYHVLVREHLAAAAQFNAEDREWIIGGRWSYTDDLVQAHWFDPDHMPLEAAARVERAWDLGTRGKELCLHGVLNLIGTYGALQYTPIQVDYVHDFPPGIYDTQSALAYNYGRPVKPHLTLVQPSGKLDDMWYNTLTN